MRDTPTQAIEQGRIIAGRFRSTSADRCIGAFVVRSPFASDHLRMLATDGVDPEAENFEHVSVSCVDRTPMWNEMH
jgi:hypothetical protein